MRKSSICFFKEAKASLFVKCVVKFSWPVRLDHGTCEGEKVGAALKQMWCNVNSASGDPDSIYVVT